MHKLTTFQNIAYASAIHANGTPHFFNDEAFFSEFYRLVLNPDQNVIDVGFNIGMQTELLSPLTTGTIYGFEASPQIFQYAYERFKNDARIHLFHRAVSDTCGTLRFINTDHWGAGSLKWTQGMEYCNVGNAYTEVEVEATTLDAALPHLNNVGLIKLDIEGAELPALAGATALIARNRPFIVMEYCHNALSFEFRGQAIKPETLRHYAREIGYTVYNIYGICLDPIEVWETSILKDTADVYLIPNEHHDRWTRELLPLYQYSIYDKILEKLEWSNSLPAFYYGLTALPSRIYAIVNTSTRSQSLTYLDALRSRLTGLEGGRATLFSTGKLTPRGELLLALIHDGKLDTAYELAALKTLTTEQLANFEAEALRLP